MTARIGRWETAPDGTVSLIASRCGACGEAFFPERRVCARCRGEAMETVRLAGPATLRTFTVVHQLPEGFSAPMAIGYAQFDGGPLVLAPIDVPADALHVGLRLDVHVGPTRTGEAGEPVLTYRFRPAAG